MKRFLTTVLFFFAAFTISQAQYYFPTIGSDDWETTSPDELGWCPEAIDSLYQFLEERSTKSFVVLKDGKIVLERYFNGHGQDSAWYWASAGKTITAFLTGIAQQEGDLDINDPTSDYLGEGWTGCTPEEEEKITIWHQLSMTTAMNDLYIDCTTPDCLECIEEPGLRWSYHNGPYRLLHKVVEEATASNYNLYTFQKLLQPTGMSGFWLITETQLLFFSKARSMARFGSLILNSGNWDGNQIMTDDTYFQDMTNTSQELNKSYGYLWWLNGKSSYRLPSFQIDFPGSISPSAPDDLIAALGRNGQFLDVVPSQGLVVVRMGEAPDNDFVPTAFHDEMWEKLNAAICTPTAEKEAVSPNIVFDVSPNPFSNQLITNDLKIGQSLHLFDFWGREVATSTQPKLETGHLPVGIYILQLKEDGQILAEERVVK